jgi:hypothetical protein
MHVGRRPSPSSRRQANASALDRATSRSLTEAVKMMESQASIPMPSRPSVF